MNDSQKKLMIGRDREIEILTSSILKPTNIKNNSIFIKGDSGVGKTSLVKHALKEFSSEHYIHLEGKFEQLNIDSASEVILQALSNFFANILSQDEETIERWRLEILEEFSINTKILTDVIPDLSLIIGDCISPPILGPFEAQKRLELKLIELLQFINKFTKKQIIFFLDDLQWASARSTQLISSIVKESNSNELFIVGAFRSEIDKEHPMINFIEQYKHHLTSINLGNLTPLDTSSIIKNIYKNCSQSEEIANLIHSKTEGNPFYTLQLLKFCEDQKLITFIDNSFLFDLDKINLLAINENILYILLQELNAIPTQDQILFIICSLINNDIKIEHLKNISNNSIETLEKYFSTYTEKKYFIKKNATQYIFAHDKIQEAAYSLAAVNELEYFHLKIGKYLKDLSTTEPLKHLAHCCYHFTKIDHLLNSIERQEIIKIYVKASNITKQKSSFNDSLMLIEQADKYFLEIADSEIQEIITFEKTELLYLNGHFLKNENFIQERLDFFKDSSNSTFIEAKLLNQLVIQKTAQGMYFEAINFGKMALAKLNIYFPETNLKEEVILELKKVKSLISEIEITSLAQKSEMKDERFKIATEILINLDSPCYLSNIDLYCLVVSKIVELSIIHGPIAASAKGFASYGIVLCSLNEFYLGYEFNKVGIIIAERFNHLGQLCRACHTMANHVQFWQQPIILGDEFNDRGFAAGHDAGEYLWAGFIRLFKPFNQFFRGKNLVELEVESNLGLDYCFKHHNQLGIDSLTGLKLIINFLFKEEDTNTTHLNFIDDCQKSKSLMSLSMYLSVKQICYLFEDNFEKAIEYELQSTSLLPYSYSVITNVYDDFVSAFLYIATKKNQENESAEKYNRHLEQLRMWSISCPENFKPLYLIIAAEESISQGNHYAGIDLYEDALNTTKENNFFHLTGFIQWRLGHHWKNLNKNDISIFYFTKSLLSYREWGAHALVEKLLKKSSIEIKGEFNKNTSQNHNSLPSLNDELNKILLLTNTELPPTFESISNLFCSLMIQTTNADKATVQFQPFENVSWVYFSYPTIEINNVSNNEKLNGLAKYCLRQKKTLYSNNESDKKIITKIIELDFENGYEIFVKPINENAIFFLESYKPIFNKQNNDIFNLLFVFFETSLKNLSLVDKIGALNIELEKQIELKTRDYKNESLKAKAYAEELQKTQHEIVNIAKAVGRTEVTANVLHNLGNSFMYVLGAISIIKDKCRRNEAQENSTFILNQLDKVDYKLKEMHKLIKDEHKYIHDQNVYEAVNVDKLLSEVSNLTSIDDKVDYRQSVNFSFPIFTDYSKIKNILINLFNNAIFACSVGQSSPSVVVFVQQIGNQIKFEITDNGIGIESDKLNEIFNPGYSTKNVDGSGFGLHHSSLTASQLGGRLIVKSNGQNMGATFSLIIPLQEMNL